MELPQLNRNKLRSLVSKLFKKGDNILRVTKNIFLGLISVLFMISEAYSGRYDNFEGMLSLSKSDTYHKMFKMKSKDVSCPPITGPENKLGFWNKKGGKYGTKKV